MGFNDEWNKIENVKTYPHFLRNIIIIDANEFVSKVMNATELQSKSLVSSIYSGDAYILKNAFTEDFIDHLKACIFEWSTKVESEFYEMRDGCLDYHCINDVPKSLSGYTSIEHSYVFFRHNKNEVDVFSPVNKYWEAIKVLSGNKRNKFVDNIPSDGIIDRMTFLQYPIGGGKITLHYDSPKSQKLLLGLLMTQIGIDYDYGQNGFYLVNHNREKVYVENIATKGDFLCVYPTLYHGVPVVTKSNSLAKVRWDNPDGRWYLQCYSAQSHEVSNREYTVAIKDEVGHGPIANYIS